MPFPVPFHVLSLKEVDLLINLRKVWMLGGFIIVANLETVVNNILETISN